MAKPVNTVVATESTAAVRGKRAADPVRAPSTEPAGSDGLDGLDGLAGGSDGDLVAANGSAAEDTVASEDALVSEDTVV